MIPVLRREDLPRTLVEDLAGRLPDDSAASPQARAPRVDGDTWLERLPGLVADACDRWQLDRDESLPLRAGFTALVVPVRRPRGDPGVLKVGWPHTESDTEHLALRAWQGRRAVQLLAADPASATLLLERLDADRDLSTGPVPGSTRVIGELLRALDRPAPPWAPTLSAALGRVGRRLERFRTGSGAGRAFPLRMVQQAESLTRDLLADTDAGGGPHPLDTRLVHGDLHQLNVLWRPDPGEWVAIDPKGLAGDPHWAVAPALRNRWDDVLAAPDARAHLRMRLHVLCAAAGLDEDRAAALTTVRLVAEAVDAVRSGGSDQDRWVARAVTIVKAVQPG